MASGIQSGTALTANTPAQIYSGPTAGQTGTANVTFTNTNTSGSVAISLAHRADGTLAAGYRLLYNYPLGANQSYEKSGIVVANTQGLVAQAAAAGVDVVVYAFEG